MIRRTRLSNGSNPMRSSSRLKPIKFTLVANMVSPDQIEISLMKNGKFVETIRTVEGGMMPDSATDMYGRLKPETVWKAINEASTYLMDRGVEHIKPNKHDIYQADYSAISDYPKVKD